MKILLVDDQFKNVETGAAQLRNLGHDVIIAFSFSEASNWLKKEEFDAVMTDVMMPGEEKGMGPETGMKFAGELTPIGLVVALLALQKNVPEIFIVSDTNHHNHPIAYALDSLNTEGRIKSRCGYDCPMIEEEGWGEVKNWAAALLGKFEE